MSSWCISLSSFGVSSKSKTSKFSAMRSFLIDFGIGIVLIWIYKIKRIYIQIQLQFGLTIYLPCIERKSVLVSSDNGRQFDEPMDHLGQSVDLQPYDEVLSEARMQSGRCRVWHTAHAFSVESDWVNTPPDW